MGMTAEEEAIGVLDSLLDGSIFNTMNYWYDHLETFYTALETSKDALKKQIPIKPTGEHYAHMRCPSCDHRIPSGQGSSSRRRDNWCNYCGQKILWE